MGSPAWSRVALMLIVAAWLGAAVHGVPDDPQKMAGLNQFRTVQIQTVEASGDQFGNMAVSLVIAGEQERLVLSPHTLRSPDVQVLIQGAGGQLTPGIMPPPATYRGYVKGRPSSLVAASIRNNEVTALIDMGHDETWFVEPAQRFDDRAQHNAHIVYRSTDVIEDDFRCGIDALAEHVSSQITDDAPSFDGGIAGSQLGICEIAFDADTQFFEDNDDSVDETIANIEEVMNAVALVYERDVFVTYEYTTFIVRTEEPDPYGTNQANEFLCEFRTTWNSEPEDDIKRDTAQLFTGKNLQRSTIGVAYNGTICEGSGLACDEVSGNSSYSIVETNYGPGVPPFNRRVGLSAHELGHSWSSPHCDGQGDCHIMCSVIAQCGGIGGDNLKFGDDSQDTILDFLTQAGCLSPQAGPYSLPFGDAFYTANFDIARWPHLAGVAINNGGMQEPSPSLSLNLDSNGTGEYADNQIRSAFIDTGQPGTVTLSYYTQHRGVGDGEELVIDYWSDDAEWVELNRITSDGVDQTAFEFWSHALPSDAKHEEFRVQFRAEVTGSTDDWYIDNICVGECAFPPVIDECIDAWQIDEGETYFSTVDGTLSASAVDGSCLADVDFASDVWIEYTPTCTGVATASTCDAVNFSTAMAVYATRQCPPDDAAIVACSATSAECDGLGSSVQFDVIKGSQYLIRIGGVDGDTGAGTVTISCGPPVKEPPCFADLEADGVVNAADLAMLLGSWGGGPEEPADLDKDGIVGASDLAQLLGAWGECESP